ncbi:MAG: hypothetical protein HC871_03105 [Rhizobiales bacterium]|nr:hypothetical protein [Hyphomicrobiales bacterium]
MEQCLKKLAIDLGQDRKVHLTLAARPRMEGRTADRQHTAQRKIRGRAIDRSARSGSTMNASFAGPWVMRQTHVSLNGFLPNLCLCQKPWGHQKLREASWIIVPLENGRPTLDAYAVMQEPSLHHAAHPSMVDRILLRNMLKSSPTSPASLGRSGLG